MTIRPQHTINLSVNPPSIPETADATTITVTATLGSAVVLITPTDVTVTVGDVSDSATEGTDYATIGDFDPDHPSSVIKCHRDVHDRP